MNINWVQFLVDWELESAAYLIDDAIELITLPHFYENANKMKELALSNHDDYTAMLITSIINNTK